MLEGATFLYTVGVIRYRSIAFDFLEENNRSTTKEKKQDNTTN